MRAKQAGFGLVEAIIACGIVGLVFAGVSAGIQWMNKSTRKMESSVDLTGVRVRLTDSLDCSNTLAGKPMPWPCPAAGYITLKNKSDQTLVHFDGTKFGKWTVRAWCSNSGIDVRAAQIKPPYESDASARNFAGTAITAARPSGYNSNHYVGDEVNPQYKYDWWHQKTQLFPAAGAGGLCGSWFGGSVGAVGCPGPGKYVRAVNFANNSVVCGDIPACSGASFLQWNGADFECLNVFDHIRNGFKCYSWTRKQGGADYGTAGIASNYDSGNAWGLTCNAGFVRSGCFIATSYDASTIAAGSSADWDVKTAGTGTCYSDQEETAHEASLTIVCCRLEI